MYDYVQIVDKKLYYNQGYIFVFFLLGGPPASEFCVPKFRNTLFFHFHRWCKQKESSCLHHRQCSETSAHKIQTTGNPPKERIQS